MNAIKRNGNCWLIGMFVKSFLPGLLVVMVLSPGPAWTEEAKPLKYMTLDELMKVDVATVTTASKSEEKATDAPATVIVISAADIMMRGYSTLKDVLRDLPGMETWEYFFAEQGTAVPVRGIMGNNKIVVLVNGMRVNPPGGENFPFRSDFSVRDAEQIEVIYGSGSTLYGRDAVSMVINIITKKPVEGTTGEAGLAGGLHNEREAWGTFGGVLGKDGLVRLNGLIQYHNSDLTPLDKAYPEWWQNYRNVAQSKGEGLTAKRSDYGLNFFARLEVGDFSIQAWYRDSRRSSSDSMSPSFGYVPEALWEDSSFVAEAKYLSRLSEKARLESTVTYNQYEVNPSTRYVWENPSKTNSWFYNDYKYARGVSYSIEETLKVDLTPHILCLAGVDATHYDIVPKCTVPGGAHGSIGDIMEEGGSFEYYKADGSGPYLIPRVYNPKYEVYGAYVEGSWKVLEGVKLMGGVRVDKDTRIDNPSVTPRAGICWNASDNFTVKYNYSTAYISPAPYFADNVYMNTYQISTANPGLEPEKSQTHEVDFNYAIKDYQLGLALYHGEQENLIQISDRNLPVNVIETVYLAPGLSQPINLIRSANGGSSYNEGLDFYGRANFGSVSPWFSYSYTTFEMDVAGAKTGLPGISHHNGRLGLTWAATSKLFITPSFMIRSTPENVQANTLDHELHTPWQANLYALYHLSKSWDLYVDLRNVTDHHYALNGLYGTAVPQETLSGVMGVRVTY